MPGPYFLLFELVIYLLFLICLAHAGRHGMNSLVKLFSAAGFGLVLEILTIWQLSAYHYGRFLIMIADVPLCIGIAWGSIIYSVMEFTDATSLPPLARPLLAGLLALNIDLAMDPIASRLGLWDWGQEPTFQFFGVPYGNFLAWFWVAASFSAGYYLISSHRDRVRTRLAGPLAIIVGLIVVFANNAFLAFVLPPNYHFHLMVLVIASALTIIASLGPQLHQRLVGPPAFWTPFLLLAYVLVAGLTSGVIFQPPVLFVVTLAMLAILVGLHWITIRHMMPRSA